MVPQANKKIYFNFLLKKILKLKIKIIIPSIEPEILFLSSRKKYLNKIGIKLLIPPINALIKLTNKWNLYKVAKSLNISTPTTLRIDFQKKIFPKSLFYPGILKPTFGWGMKNFHIINAKKDFDYLKNKLRGKFIYQRYIPSNKKNIYAVSLLYDGESNARLEFVSRSIRTKYKYGGPATAGVEVENKVLVKSTKNLINGIGHWQGPVMVEWIKNLKNNRYYLIDVNPRIWGYSLLATFNGKNFPLNIIHILKRKKVIVKKDKRKYLFLRDFIDKKIILSKKN